MFQVKPISHSQFPTVSTFVSRIVIGSDEIDSIAEIPQYSGILEFDFLRISTTQPPKDHKDTEAFQV